MSAAGTAALLRRTADAIDAGEVTDPIVSLQFIITGEADQDAALLSSAALFPGFRWEGRLTESDLLGPGVHVHGRAGRAHVVISARADRLEAATVASLTAQEVAA